MFYKHPVLQNFFTLNLNSFALPYDVFSKITGTGTVASHLPFFESTHLVDNNKSSSNMRLKNPNEIHLTLGYNVATRQFNVFKFRGSSVTIHTVYKNKEVAILQNTRIGVH
jgi:hypothetical protein